MKNYASQIEKDMNFLLSKDLKKSLDTNEAIQHLIRAHELLECVGLSKHSTAISCIIKRAQSIDESDIEVVL